MQASSYGVGRVITHSSPSPDPKNKDMSHCAFIYTPSLSAHDIHSLLDFLPSIGLKITHLGKRDPPKRWTGDVASVLAIVLSGTDLTNYTFLRDQNAGVHFSIELHGDPRWDGDTISFSGADAQRLNEIAEKVGQALHCHAAIVGVSGGGKDQNWRIVHISQECPELLRSKFSKAKEVVAPNRSLAPTLNSTPPVRGSEE